MAISFHQYSGGGVCRQQTLFARGASSRRPSPPAVFRATVGQQHPSPPHCSSQRERQGSSEQYDGERLPLKSLSTRAASRRGALATGGGLALTLWLSQGVPVRRCRLTSA